VHIAGGSYNVPGCQQRGSVLATFVWHLHRRRSVTSISSRQSQSTVSRTTICSCRRWQTTSSACAVPRSSVRPGF